MVKVLEYERLDKIAYIYGGLRVTRYADKDNSKKMTVLKKINNNQNLLETETIKLPDSIDKKYYSKENDILIQVTSTNNTINMITRDNVIIPANYVIVRAKKGYNPHYILSLLRSNQFKKVERKLSGGTKLHFIKVPDIRKMRICIPKLEKQNKIVNIQKLIDRKNQLETKKIEINNMIQEAIFIKELGEKYVR